MRVLWFTNSVMPVIFRHIGRNAQSSGPWMATMLEELRRACPDLQLQVATVAAGFPEMVVEEAGVEYVIIRTNKRLLHWSVQDERLKECAQLVDRWQPDVVHVHGTELAYGLLSARQLIHKPTVISIQGLVGECAKHVLGNLSWKDLIKAHRFIEIVRGTGLLNMRRQYRIRGLREIEIIKNNKYFIGRTHWDYSHVHAYNPEAKYFHVGEIMRPQFTVQQWDILQCRRHSLIFTNVSGPLKGVDVILDAMVILRREFPQLRLQLAGHINKRTGYGRFFLQQIKKMNLTDSVDYLGYLDAQQMAQALTDNHVFVIASHIENSPNSLAEAQLVGMPCVASFTGGIPSMISGDETGLFFPPGDSHMLANQIKKIFLDDDLACKLGSAARNVAKLRDSPQNVIDQLLGAYKEVIIDYSKAKETNETNFT